MFAVSKREYMLAIQKLIATELCFTESKFNKSYISFSSIINSFNRQQFYCVEPSIEMRRDNLLKVTTVFVFVLGSS